MKIQHVTKNTLEIMILFHKLAITLKPSHYIHKNIDLKCFVKQRFKRLIPFHILRRLMKENLISPIKKSNQDQFNYM